MLESIEIFAHLTPVQLHQLESISLFRNYTCGEIVFYQGDHSDYFHFLLEGEVTLYKSNDSGTFEVHRFRGPSMFAESSTLQNIPFPATAEALTSCRILKLHRDPFLQLLQEDARLSIAIITSLSKKVASLQRLNDQLSAPNAYSKIVRLMLDRPDVFSTLKGIEIAKIAGIAPETLSRIMTKFKKENLIVFKPRRVFQILDRNGLQKYR
jgi:CRP/FNR family transcriptional regulator